jgi:paraquat-inducible protein B
LVNNLDSEMKSLADNLNQAVIDSRGLIVDIHNEIKPLAAKTNETLNALSKIVSTVDDSIEPLTKSMTDALEAATEAISGVNELVGETSPTRDNLDTALAEFALAARSLRTLADYLEQHPDALLKGKGYKNY